MFLEGKGDLRRSDSGVTTLRNTLIVVPGSYCPHYRLGAWRWAGLFNQSPESEIFLAEEDIRLCQTKIADPDGARC